MLSLEHHRACEEVDKLQMELKMLSKEREDLSARVSELDSSSAHTSDFQVNCTLIGSTFTMKICRESIRLFRTYIIVVYG